jgi:ribosomal protein L30/L7E
MITVLFFLFVNIDTSINEIAPKPRKIMQLLRLLQINNGVFVKVTRATQQMLRLIEPYITYGSVSYITGGLTIETKRN